MSYVYLYYNGFLVVLNSFATLQQDLASKRCVIEAAIEVSFAGMERELVASKIFD